MQGAPLFGLYFLGIWPFAKGRTQKQWAFYRKKGAAYRLPGQCIPSELALQHKYERLWQCLICLEACSWVHVVGLGKWVGVGWGSRVVVVVVVVSSSEW